MAVKQKEYLFERLREQTHFLLKSLEAFYAGDIAEAVRIAVTIRVLVHKTQRSNALLEQIDPNYLDLVIRDKSKDVHNEGKTIIYVPTGFRLRGRDISPYVDFAAPHYEVVRLEDWWKRVCLILPDRDSRVISFERREIILTIANKEGGAHVANLPRKHELLWRAPMEFVHNDQPMDSVHVGRYFAAQSGAELLDCINRRFGLGETREEWGMSG